jgi:hypothetical protein
MSKKPHRVVVYDASEEKRNPFLRASWYWGAKLYVRRGRLTPDPDDDFDTYFGAWSFDEMLDWLLKLSGDIARLDYWGHGAPGGIYCDQKRWGALEFKGKYKDRLNALGEKLTPQALVWFRTCATFHGVVGQEFATRWSEGLGVTVAAHTYNIGPWQSGLHTIGPGEEPSWSKREGADKNGRLQSSGPWAPNTVFCTDATLPEGW